METGVFNCLLPSASCLLLRRRVRVTRSAIPFAKGFAACALLALASGLARAQNHVPRVEKVEPPSWWAGHTVNPVRVLIRGQNLLQLFAGRDSPFEVSNQQTDAAHTYLFADLRINPDARPGDYELTVSSGVGTARVPFRINRPLD